MDHDATVELVNLLLDYQYDMFWVRGGPWGLNHIEFLFLETEIIVRSSVEARVWMMAEIESSIKCGLSEYSDAKTRPSGAILTEFILFLAHRTRWKEFLEIARGIEGTEADLWKSNRIHTWSSQLRAALDESWTDREFYSCLSEVRSN